MNGECGKPSAVSSDAFSATLLSRRLILGTQLVFNIGFYAVVPFLAVHMADDLAMSSQLIGIVLGVRTFSQQGLFFIGGLLAERLGSRWLLLAGCAVRVSGYVAFAFAGSVWGMLLGACLTGVGGAMFSPCLEALAARPVVLEARNATWRVRGATLVQDVSLSLHAGEMLGLIGPNGSGKSSFLRLLAGVNAPSAGEVFLEGQPMQGIARRMVARRLALVSQMADTVDAITVQDAVELGRTPWLSALQTWSQRDDDIVDEALALVGMAEKREQYWSTLSGGERQRTHIARSLAQQPSILLLDEPTNHLDIHHQLSLMHLIRGLSESMTIAVAIHDLNHALMCDRLAVMYKGRLVRVDVPDKVLEPSLVREVFEVDVSELADPKDQARVLRFMPL